MKSEDEISQFAPWEQEQKEKKKTERGGIIPPQTGQKARLRSKRKGKDHDYLELYLRAKEKERLEKYGKTLGRRVKSIASTWKEVKSTMDDIQSKLSQVSKKGIEEAAKGEKENKTEKKIAGNMRKIDWNY